MTASDARPPTDTGTRVCELCGKPERAAYSRFCTDTCRLMSKVETEGECWMWASTRDRHGYGLFSMGKRHVGAHRAAYTLLRGVIPEGMDLDHLCRNRACVNPDHLEPVTRRTNTLRGAAPTALLYLANECSRGHEMTPENTYTVPSNGERRCRICVRAYTASVTARSKEK